MAYSSATAPPLALASENFFTNAASIWSAGGAAGLTLWRPLAIFMRMAQLDRPQRSTVLRLRRTQFSLSGTVPDSVALWNRMCAGLLPPSLPVAVASEMEMSAGLRWPAGSARSRVRRALPSSQAVSVVKVRKVYSSLVSWAIRTAGCVGLDCWVSFWAFH